MRHFFSKIRSLLPLALRDSGELTLAPFWVVPLFLPAHRHPEYTERRPTHSKSSFFFFLKFSFSFFPLFPFPEHFSRLCPYFRFFVILPFSFLCPESPFFFTGSFTRGRKLDSPFCMDYLTCFYPFFRRFSPFAFIFPCFLAFVLPFTLDPDFGRSVHKRFSLIDVPRPSPFLDM